MLHEDSYILPHVFTHRRHSLTWLNWFHSVSHTVILHCLTVKEEVRPSYQKRSIKITSCSITANSLPPSAQQPPSQDAPLGPGPGPAHVPLVNNRKGSLLPAGPCDPTQLRLSISESRLNRARSLPVKYRYHPSNAMLHNQSRHCRFLPWAGCISRNPHPAPQMHDAHFTGAAVMLKLLRGCWPTAIYWQPASDLHILQPFQYGWVKEFSGIIILVVNFLIIKYILM